MRYNKFDRDKLEKRKNKKDIKDLLAVKELYTNNLFSCFFSIIQEEIPCAEETSIVVGFSPEHEHEPGFHVLSIGDGEEQGYTKIDVYIAFCYAEMVLLGEVFSQLRGEYHEIRIKGRVMEVVGPNISWRSIEQ